MKKILALLLFMAAWAYGQAIQGSATHFMTATGTDSNYTVCGTTCSANNFQLTFTGTSVSSLSIEIDGYNGTSLETCGSASTNTTGDTITCSSSTGHTYSYVVVKITTLTGTGAKVTYNLSSRVGSFAGGGVALPVSIANGGTGSTTAAAARSALSAAQSGANSDITSLSGLTSPVPPPAPSGLTGEYWFDSADTTGSGGLLDHSGNGNNCTVPTTANAPVFDSTNGRGVKFISSTVSGISCPSALNSTTVTIVIVTYYDANSVSCNNNFPSLFGYTTSGGPTIFYDTYLAGSCGGAGISATILKNRATLWDGSSFNYNDVYAGNTYQIFTYENGSPIKTWVNGLPSRFAWGTNFTSMSGGSLILGNSLSGGCNGGANCVFLGTIYYAAVYSGTLSSSDVQAANSRAQAIVSSKGVPLTAAFDAGAASGSNVVVALGDSITTGQGLTANTAYPNVATLTATYSKYNFSRSGICLSLSNTNSGFGYYLGFAANYGGTTGAYASDVLFMFLGTNDMALCAKTPAQVATSYQQFISYCHQNYRKCGIGTVLSRGDVANFDTTLKDVLNPLIRNGWQAWGYDFMVDFASDPVLGADGANANVTYFQDTVHPTATGETHLTSMYQDAINMVTFGNTLGNPTTPTNTYQMLSSDLYVYADTTAHTFTLTLPDCLGKTGLIYSIMNAKAGAGHTLTVSGLTASETIETTTAVAQTTTLADGAALQLRAQLISDAAAGCTWKKVN